MNLNNLVARYSIPADNFKVHLPDDPPVVLEFRRVRNSAEMAQIKQDALEWAENARALAPDNEARHALGELTDDKGRECIVQACIMAETVLGVEGTLDERRYSFCRMAAEAGPYFDIIQRSLTFSLISESFLQLQDAEEGKADSGPTPDIEPS